MGRRAAGKGEKGVTEGSGRNRILVGKLAGAEAFALHEHDD
jgi:hypothetical protein